MDTKIAKSGDLGTRANCKRNKSVEFGIFQYALNRVAQPTSVTNSSFLLAIVATPIDCAHHCIMHKRMQQLMHTTDLICVGKGDQQHTMYDLHANDADARCAHVGLPGMCSIAL